VIPAVVLMALPVVSLPCTFGSSGNGCEVLDAPLNLFRDISSVLNIASQNCYT